MLRTRGLFGLFRCFTVRYSKDHEWVHFDEKTNTGTMGISEHAQSLLGDVVHLSLPALNSRFNRGEIMSTIESVKVVEDIYMPLSGTIIEINTLVKDHPEVINQSAESNGWIAKLKVDNPRELYELMDSASYKQYLIEHKDS